MNKRSKSKSLRKLHGKRLAIARWLGVSEAIGDKDLLELAYEKIGRDHKEFGPISLSPAGLHSRFSLILSKAGLTRVPVERARPKKKKKDHKPNGGIFSPAMQTAVQKFYRSYEWRKLRYEVLKKHGAHCQCCGQSREHGAVIHVDHIKSLRKFWELRLVESNLQVLCDACNHGKGNWDDTDWRDPLTKEYEAILH